MTFLGCHLVLRSSPIARFFVKKEADCRRLKDADGNLWLGIPGSPLDEGQMMIYPNKEKDESLYWFKKADSSGTLMSNISEVNPFSCFTPVELKEQEEENRCFSPLSLLGQIDTNNNGRLERDEIEKAVKKSPARFYLRLAACKHPSEWFLDAEKRNREKPASTPKDQFEAFEEVDNKMTFLHQVNGFKKGEELCHFHPIAFVEHLKKLAPLGWPLDRNKIRMGSNSHTFGTVRRNGRIHQGWDFEALQGTPIFAVSNGTVVWLQHQYTPKVDYGKQIVISFHLDGKEYFAHYAHLDEISVTKGQQVSIGQQIGKTGNTGNAWNMKGLDQHLHFEIRTKHFPGKQLNDRISSYKLYKVCPLKEAVMR